MRQIKTDFLVIGSGVAGLATALWAAQHGEVVILSKDRADNCNTALAQGGIAAAVGQNDSPELHLADTLSAGAGSCWQDAVEVLTGEAPEIIRTLQTWGVNFDLDEKGQPALAREGAHSLPRVLHHGDNTGAEIWRALYAKLLQTKGVTLLSNTHALEIILNHGQCTGVVAQTQGENTLYTARGVVLATGGCGRIFGCTTNSNLSTGDGLALAWQAGAELTDLEFIQFHPSALDLGDNPLFLISEAVRGDGAVLINSEGKPFMPAYHPMADLAPRDVVSRAILTEQAKGQKVFLDARSLAGKFPMRFPNIYEKLKLHSIDPAADPIPVTPAAHFMMGGIRTDCFGQTNIPGLFACGETASTGVHGANRLASNSLLEGLVFGRRVAAAMARLRTVQTSDFPGLTVKEPGQIKPLAVADSRLTALQEIMWSRVGIVRNGQMLSEALRLLDDLDQQLDQTDFELKNMLLVAKLMAQAALKRQESRGSHFRSDYPAQDQAYQQKHFVPRRYSA